MSEIAFLWYFLMNEAFWPCIEISINNQKRNILACDGSMNKASGFYQ